MLTDSKLQSIKPPAKGQQEHADHKVTGLRLRVGAGGAKTWILRRRVGGKVINRKLGVYPALKLAKAREAAEGMIEALERDGSTEGIDRPFGEVAARWIDHCKNEKGNRRWQDQERQLELHVLPHWKGRRIAEIKRRDVRDLIEGLEGEVLPNRILALVKALFGYAVERDFIDASPADRIKRTRTEKARDRVLDMGEVARVWKAADLIGYPLGPWAQILMLTAQRRGEVATMRWADLDLKEATWTIPSEVTKADRAQLVPLAPAAVEILSNMPQLGPYVFTTTGETPISGFAKAKSRIDLYLASKGDPLDGWRFHDLRRSAASHMVRLGIPELVVSRVLNHAVTGVTGRHYALHTYGPEKRHALEAWAAEIDRAVNGAKGDNVVAING